MDETVQAGLDLHEGAVFDDVDHQAGDGLARLRICRCVSHGSGRRSLTLRVSRLLSQSMDLTEASIFVPDLEGAGVRVPAPGKL